MYYLSKKNVIKKGVLFKYSRSSVLVVNMAYLERGTHSTAQAAWKGGIA